MNDQAVIEMLSALAQEHRLKMFRALVKAGPSGLAASDIAESVGIGPTGASFHLKELVRGNLIAATRDGRFIRYAVRVDSMRALLAYLTEDCCQGRPELCGPLLEKSKTVWSSKGNASWPATSPSTSSSSVRTIRPAPSSRKR